MIKLIDLANNTKILTRHSSQPSASHNSCRLLSSVLVNSKPVNAITRDYFNAVGYLEDFGTQYVNALSVKKTLSCGHIKTLEFHDCDEE